MENIDGNTDYISIADYRDKGYAWVILTSSFVLNLLSGVTLTTFGVYLVELVDYYQISKFCVGILGGIQTGITTAGKIGSSFSRTHTQTQTQTHLLGTNNQINKNRTCQQDIDLTTFPGAIQIIFGSSITNHP